ncbi:cysteine hydrolase family protein [Spirosoma arcticum]
MTKQDKPALLLVDIQKGFDDVAYWGGHRNNPEAEANAGKLLAFWRQNDLPRFHIKHCSTNPNSRLVAGKPGNEFQDAVRPTDGETIIQKNTNSAFIGTNLQQQLDAAGIKTVVIVGLTTDHCVSTTTRMAGNYGYDTYIVSDATATFDKVGADGQHYSAEIIHETSLASLHNEFATVLKTAELIDKLR